MKAWLLSLLAHIVLSSWHASAAEKPNVLLILVDDLKPALGCYGDSTAKTPNIDALAESGMRFDLAYCNQAVCAPSRFTLMLGSHSSSTGLYGLGSPLRKRVPDAVTMPQHFAKHGYRTESLGKVFHIGHGNEGDPESFSISHFKEKVIEYVDPASTDGGKLTREEAYFTNQRLDEIRSLPRGAAFEAPEVDDEAYADGRVAAETIHRLKEAKKRAESEGTPFFIAAGFARPHLPFSAPKKYWDLYDPETLPMPMIEAFPESAPKVATKRGGEIANYFPVPDHEAWKQSETNIDHDLSRELIHGYYASASFVDAQIGKVLNGLKELGLADNTIVVLWGDHGFHLGDLGIWTKHTNYEQATRIPILIRAPGVTEPGSSTRQLAESVDIYPTVAELAGLPAPKGPQLIDGISLVPVLKDSEARVRDHAYHVYPRGKVLGRAIRDERYRMVEWKIPGAPAESAEVELYDYQDGTVETRNIAGERPEVVEKMRAILATYPEAVGEDGGKSAKRTGAAISPTIQGVPLKIVAEVTPPQGGKKAPHGVILAQGGREHGYALHFVDGTAAFDVRVNGKVTRLTAARPSANGRIQLTASLTDKTMSLTVSDQPAVERPSPGLIPVQPKDDLSIGEDLLSAAGDYAAPNPFNGTIISSTVEADRRSPKGK